MTPPAHTARDLEAASVTLCMALARQLAEEGLLDDHRWRHAVETVPRHRFVPGFYLCSAQPSSTGMQVWEPVTATIDPDRWLQAVYEDQTLNTQFDGDEPDWDHPVTRIGGAATSSSTLPSLVVRMWLDADLDEDHNVLEIGTGTGYSTALAWEFLGALGDLTSIDVDPHRLDQAATVLFGCGYNPNLAVADGLYGYQPHAPYDRIVAACSVRAIPGTWLRQTRAGGKILTTLGGWLHGYARTLLTVADDGTAQGRLLPGTISFMAARAQSPPPPGNPYHWAGLTSDTGPRPARHSPGRLDEPTAEGFFARFLAQLAAPDAQLSYMGDDTYLIDVSSGSVAILTPGDGAWLVRQSGPVALWDAVEDTWDLWDDAGRPGPEAFRMSVRPGEQRICHATIPELSFALPMQRSA